MVSRVLTVSALVLFAAVAPVLPPIAWKVKATFLAALLLAGGLYMRARAGGSVGRSALDVPALAFLAAAVLATLLSVDPVVSFHPSRFRGEGLIVYLAYVALALAAARFTPGDVRGVITALLIAGAVIGLIAIPQYYGVDTLQWLGFRPVAPLVFSGPNPVELRFDSAPIGVRGQGTLGNPIFLGAYAALLLPLAAALAVQAKRRAAWAYGTVAMILYAALVASQTRSAWIASAVAGLLLVRVLPRSRQNWRRWALLAAGFLVVTAGLVLTHPDASLTRRASSALDVLETKDYSLRQKLYVWKHTLPLVAQRPVLGWGFSTLIGQFKDLGSPEYLSAFGRDQIVLVDTPHNELLHVAYSTGLVGLAAYLWMWAVAARGVLDRLRAGRVSSGGTASPGGATSPSIGGALAVSLAAYFIWMQFAWSMVGPANVLWAILGLAAAEWARAPEREAGADADAARSRHERDLTVSPAAQAP